MKHLQAHLHQTAEVVTDDEDDDDDSSIKGSVFSRAGLGCASVTVAHRERKIMKHTNVGWMLDPQQLWLSDGVSSDSFKFT